MLYLQRERESKEENKQIQSEQKQNEDDKQALELQSITVLAEKPNEITLKKATLSLQPNTTKTITGTLRGDSNIQFDGLALDTMTGGSITPPKISIRGAHHYENNFMINGMSNNNIINPGGFDEKATPHTKTDIYGDSQAMFINTGLLESVTAYTENISAAYGDFLGGVVDAKIKDAQKDRWHFALRGRHTRDQWAKKHYHESNKPADFPLSKDGQHTKFQKWSLGATVEGPIFDNLGLIVSYDRKWSTIPVYQLFNKQDLPNEKISRRLNENYLIRMDSLLADNISTALTATYAPYSAKMFPHNVKDGEYFIKGGGLGLNLTADINTTLGEWKNIAAFSRTEVSRDSNSDVTYNWKAKLTPHTFSKYATWTKGGVANEGMFGDVTNHQNTYELKSHFQFQDFATDILQHKILAGMDLKLVQAKHDFGGYTVYNVPKTQAGVTGSLTDGIVEGEQYTSQKQDWYASSKSKGYNTAAVFLEDTAKVERFTLRPGLRLSWDNITQKTNLAPRIFANIDILNDKQFNLFGGLNRYYGSQLLAYAVQLRPSGKKYKRNWVAGNLTPWTFDSLLGNKKTLFKLGDMKTPYTDEYTVGASALIFDTNLSVTYVNRKYEDQMRTHKKVAGKETLTNDGKSKYWGITINAKKVFDLDELGQHICKLAATYSETKSNYAEWERGFAEDDFNNYSNYVKLNGKWVTRDKLPTGNFAAPWVITYSQEMRFLDNSLRLMPVLRYETGGKLIHWTATEASAPDGKPTRRYETADRKDIFNADLSAQYDVAIYNEHILTAELDITNLFDRINTVDIDAIKIANKRRITNQMGRQFYLGLKYSF